MSCSLRARFLVVARFAAIVFAGSGCRAHYRAPDLPMDKLATVSLDARATLLSVDGLPPPRGKRTGHSKGGAERQVEFLVGPGCRAFTAKYEESYFIWGEKRAVRAGLGPGLWPALANTENRTYSTLKPIQFFVPVRAGYRYWVTATFTGAEFLPRVVEIEPSGEASARFLPDVPCGASPPPGSDGN